MQEALFQLPKFSAHFSFSSADAKRQNRWQHHKFWRFTISTLMQFLLQLVFQWRRDSQDFHTMQWTWRNREKYIHITYIQAIRPTHCGSYTNAGPHLRTSNLSPLWSGCIVCIILLWRALCKPGHNSFAHNSIGHLIFNNHKTYSPTGNAKKDTVTSHSCISPLGAWVS